ncbi:MAG: FKBP-type peptidyl-prolyl cis-trans isomerase [Ignavibacteriae bacterium]|nr:FKBP-type peptidyl-prolyl cis-trans isomerase [Ignavibacteriota bacterium]MCB9215950.1 FKBP-type peptidyl-prolyl cis-trans isomerase [Ignavibacteria bacterium]
MKRFITPLVVGAVLLIAGCDNGGGKVALKSLDDSASYAIGMNAAQGMLKPQLDQASKQGVNIDRAIFAAAIRDVLSDTSGKGILEDTVAQAVLVRWQETMTAQKKQENQKFLDENKSKAGVKVTPSGLQYVVVQEGSGESPTDMDSVVVNYKGMLVDSTVFDQSPEGEPRTFMVGGVIEGWKEALKMMKPGAKWKLFIPSSIAYGDQGTAGIPPGAVLIFDVELVSVKKN